MNNLLRIIRGIRNALAESLSYSAALNAELDLTQAKLEKAIASAKELSELGKAEPGEAGESLEDETKAKEGFQAEIDRLRGLGAAPAATE